MLRLFYILLLLLPSAKRVYPQNDQNDHSAATDTLSKKKKIIFIAGLANHDVGEHEYRGGCLLLARLLNENVRGITAIVYERGWPADSTIFNDAAAIVIYCNGGERHVLVPHLPAFDNLMKKGIGLVALHPAVEAPVQARTYFFAWLGAYFETYYSVNPRWTANFKSLPSHEITNGVKPFALKDEWYYHLRFADGTNHISPILKTVPPASSLLQKDGAYSGNVFARAAVANGESQILAWTFDRTDGGRSVGFTGAHYHNNWKNDDFRKLVLNAITWAAKIAVPSQGVVSSRPSKKELHALLDEVNKRYVF